MSTFSAWHWFVVLVGLAVIAVPIGLIAWSIRKRPTSTEVSGIGGWLILLAIGLCAGLLKNVLDLAKALPDLTAGWENPTARAPLAFVIAVSLALDVALVWAIFSLFRKKRSLKRAYGVLWLLSVVMQLSMLTLLVVPGVTLQMVLPPADIARAVAGVFIMGAWFWYLSVSHRVRNTMVN